MACGGLPHVSIFPFCKVPVPCKASLIPVPRKTSLIPVPCKTSLLRKRRVPLPHLRSNRPAWELWRERLRFSPVALPGAAILATQPCAFRRKHRYPSFSVADLYRGPETAPVFFRRRPPTGIIGHSGVFRDGSQSRIRSRSTPCRESASPPAAVSVVRALSTAIFSIEE